MPPITLFLASSSAARPQAKAIAAALATESIRAAHVEALASPILAKGRPDEAGRVRHYLYDDPETDAILTATLRHKLRQAGLDDTGAAVRFDPAHLATAKTKLFRYKQVQCKGSICPVLVRGTSEQIQFAWEVGVGHSTGIGCGALV